MKNKKTLVMGFLLITIILLSVGTVAYFRRIVNGNITGQAGNLVLIVNEVNAVRNETFLVSLNRSSEEPFVMPGDSGTFDINIDSTGSSTDVDVTITITNINLPENLKFYLDEAHTKKLTTRTFSIPKSDSMTKTVPVYWYWDGTVDDENDTLFAGQALTANVSVSAVSAEYTMMNWELLNGIKSMLNELTFTNDLSNLPECTAENMCEEISYEENQKYPVYAYMTLGDEVEDPNNPGQTIQLVNMLVASAKPVLAPTDCSELFMSATNLKTVNFNDAVNTRPVTDMSYMFAGCTSLTNLNLGVLDTSNVTDMSWMFTSSALTSLDLNFSDTSNVTSMARMFYNCVNLTDLNLGTLDTSSVTNMEYMFYECQKLTSLDLSSFDTRNVTTMYSMFSGCESLTSLDLNGFDTGNVTTMYSMFSGCDALTSLDLSGFDTGNVGAMSFMFKNCTNLTNLIFDVIDISSDPDMQNMFDGCANLVTEITIIMASNIGDYNQEYSQMFLGAATEPGAEVIVNYTSATSSLVDIMIATKSANSNVVKGSLVS